MCDCNSHRSGSVEEALFQITDILKSQEPRLCGSWDFFIQIEFLRDLTEIR